QVPEDQDFELQVELEGKGYLYADGDTKGTEYDTRQIAGEQVWRFGGFAAKELAPRHITVNAVAPGYIRTAMTDKLTQDQKDQMLKLVPLGRMGEAADVAAAVAFLASDDAGYVTGQVLTVDGGMVM
ncbi:MAG TPA: SDR family oxidoreductase, partial [Planctomycetota bacterium]|nr:SDR family oxidoreductase [Planctomycetota bacterium]